jgi:CRP/FNR family transcriptional regulator, cyclic AMP receptor protein
MIEVSPSALATHAFLHGMPRGQLDTLAAVATDVTFPARHRIFEEGGHASRFWLIRSGCVLLDLHVPERGTVVVEPVCMGQLLGWSWLFPPFRWAFGAVADGPVTAFEVNAAAARACCAADPALGYELTRRLAEVVARRLEATRIRLLTTSSPQEGQY